MTFAYDYQNMHTRGWVRGEFEDFNLAPADRNEAASALEAVAKSWANGTNFRLVQIADDGAETFPKVTAKGSRGPLPKDRQTS